jgi:hypothetical protein
MADLTCPTFSDHHNFNKQGSSGYRQFPDPVDDKYGHKQRPDPNLEAHKLLIQGRERAGDIELLSMASPRNTDIIDSAETGETMSKVTGRSTTERKSHAYFHREAEYDSLEEEGNGDGGGNLGNQIATKAPPSVHKKRSVLASWKWEMLALLISMLCMAAIIGILAAMKDKLSTSWKGGSVSINAAITGLSTITNMGIALAVPACLDQEKWRYLGRPGQRLRLRHFSLLEQGSSGPFAAAKVIWSVRWGLAVLASFIIIFDVVTSFMIQQAVKVDSGSEWANDTSSPAYYSYAQSYDAGLYDLFDEGIIA